MPNARRTCVVTRTEADRDALVRLVVDPEGRLMVDRRARLPGRGAWILPTSEAFARLPKVAGRLRKQLGATVVDPDALRQQLVDGLTVDVLDGLSLAARRGALVPGQDRVVTAASREELGAVVLAEDLSDRTNAWVRDRVGEVELFTLPMSQADLGARVGRGSTGVLGLRRGRATATVLRWLRRLADLG